MISITRKLRKSSAQWKSAGYAKYAGELLASAELIEAQAERIRLLEAAGNISEQALEMVRVNVEHEIRAREIAGHSSNQWPDVLTGCHSGGGIIPAIENWRTAKASKP